MILFFFAAFAFNICAQEKDVKNNNFKECSIITSFYDEKIEYQFASIEDLEKNLETILKDADCAGKEDKKKESELVVELRLGIIKDNIRNITSEKITIGCTQEKMNIALNKLKSAIHAVIDKDTVCQMSK